MIVGGVGFNFSVKVVRVQYIIRIHYCTYYLRYTFIIRQVRVTITRHENFPKRGIFKKVWKENCKDDSAFFNNGK